MSALKHIVRRLTHAPLFTIATLITLAIGIGATSAIFSLVSGVLLKPLPFKDSDRLVAIWQTAPGLNVAELNAAPSTYFLYREENRTFEDVALWRGDSVSVTGTAQPEEVEALAVTDGLLPLLSVQPAYGRFFNRKDDLADSPKTVILSYGYWQRQFGSDPNAVGRTIRLNGKLHEIIGVLPKGFRFMHQNPGMVIPFQLDRAKAFVGNFSYQAVARLKPGISLAQANADVARMLTMLTTKFPLAPGMSKKMIEEAKLGPSIRLLKDDLVGDIGKTLWLLMGTVSIVLLIACANVANLLLVRAEARQQELTIRAALGAGFGAIARELLLESILLGLAGGAIGIGVAYGAVKLIVALGAAQLPRLENVSIDWQVLAFALVVSLIAGILFGLIPVFKYAAPGLGMTLRQGGRNTSDSRERHRARNALVMVQVAMALVLLISSGLMIRTVSALRHVEPGFTDPDSVLTLRVSIPQAQVPDAEQTVRVEQQIVEKLAAIPGVSSVSAANSITMDGHTDNDPVFAEDHTYSEGQIPPIRRFKFVAPGFFKTMGNRLLLGRDLTWTDILEKRNVVLVSEALARALWKDPSVAVGKRVRENPRAPWREVVGVVGNERDNGVDQPPTETIYWPLIVREFWGDAITVQRNLAFAVRGQRVKSSDFFAQARDAVWSVNPNFPLANVRTVGEIYRKSMARTMFMLIMLGVAASMALILGVVGIYGVISYSVTRRTREIGIRLAIGAQQETIRRMFVREGLVLAGIGLVGGFAAALALARMMSSVIFGVSAFDPITYLSAAISLLAAATLASYLPARRAAVVDPASALVAE